MKLLQNLIILALVIFPFGEFLRFEIGNNIVIKPLDVMVGLVGLVGIGVLIANRHKTKLEKSIILPLSLFSFLGLFSLVLNLYWLTISDVLPSVLYLVRWVSYGLLLIAISQVDKKFKRTISKLLFLDGIVVLFFGYLQYFFFNSLKSLYYQGWDEHMHRMFTTLFDPNFAGAFFVLYFLFVASRLAVVQSKNNRVMLSFLLALTLIAIFLTFSRAALLMLIVGSAILLFLLQKKRLFFGVLAAVVGFIVVVSPLFYDENMNLFREASSKARLENYATALRIFQDHPLFGIGFNSYRYAKEAYGIQAGWTGAPSHADAGVDNSFLFVMVTTGVVGLGVYLWLWWRIAKQAWSPVILASIGALFVNALFINSLFFPFLLFWVYCLVGIQEKQ